MTVKTIRHINDLVIGLNKDISERFGRGKELAISILPSVDSRIYGLNKRKLIIIAGRPSMGKSTLMMNLAWCFAEQKKKIMFFNLETTNMEFMERLFCYVSGSNNFDVKCGRIINNDDYVPKISEFAKRTAESDCFITESYGKTFDEIVEAIDKTGDDYECIFIDYLQKIKMVGKSERESMDKYLNKLTELAIERNVCIVLGSQINRGTYDGKKIEAPMLHELKGSGGIEEKAHQVWLIHWGWWYDNEKTKDEYRIHIAKNKDGRTGVIQANFDPETYKIYEKEGGNEYDPGYDYKEREDRRDRTAYFND